MPTTRSKTPSPKFPPFTKREQRIYDKAVAALPPSKSDAEIVLSLCPRMMKNIDSMQKQIRVIKDFCVNIENTQIQLAMMKKVFEKAQTALKGVR